ncbi:CRISPR-associated endoribonuclease Cas6 [Methanocaldococcus villosus]|uniref:CRISPR-associated endoribonuclease Cas6 n=1 Tax=Methanocaldococcus villosus TaxID=667126 RepID=UPI00064E1708|nr:CRISPR-associated endoribonuclease Cas6 [Methanocaldococcus villosus]
MEFATEKNTIIPFNHQYPLALAICNILKSIDKLQKYDKYEFFTFSLLQIPKREITKLGIKTLDGRIFLHIASPNNEFLKTFIKGILECESFKVDNIELVPITLTFEDIPKQFNILKTISPIYLRTTIEENGKKKIYDLLPNHSKFYENLKKNLKMKYEAFYNKKCNFDFDFEILKFKTKRMLVKNTYCRCTEMVFRVWGDYEIIKFGYECGFGEWNSMGFGMVIEGKDENNSGNNRS